MQQQQNLFLLLQLLQLQQQHLDLEYLFGMVQINDAVNNLDQITQKNAQSASEANEIAKQTLKISNEIIEQVNSKCFYRKIS